MEDVLSHFNPIGRARLVDISSKKETPRMAIASGVLRLRPETLRRIQDNSIAKGNVLTVADVAAVQAAKRTAEWIPLCHPISLQGIDVEFTPMKNFTPPNDFAALEARVTVWTIGRTGVEMEALCATSAALLTIIDMCKSMDKTMWIERVLLEEKTGGTRGDWIRGAEGVSQAG